MGNFENLEQWHKFCEDKVMRIYYANIACNNDAIRDEVQDIAGRLHVAEGDNLIGDNTDE